MKCKILIFVIVVTIFPLGILLSNTVYGATNYNINATVKISVCGNGVVEGGEECDGINLHAKTCQNLKFRDGNLSCDISCSFNTSQCITVAQAITTTIASYTAPSTPTISFTSTLFPTGTSQSILPPALQIFDINGSGHITASELPDILKMWITAWKNYSEHKECDLTRDGTCEIRDLSVLLYYVDR